jgi:M6 family metalloprotease-like protein
MMVMPGHHSGGPARMMAMTGVFMIAMTRFVTETQAGCIPRDPFRILDAQKWVNPDDMVWEDFVSPPGTDWANPERKGSSRNFNVALIAVDYPDMPFVVTQPVNSTIFGNPQPSAYGLARESVPAFYRDLLNKPSQLNHFHTMHEYWMGDSFGKYGVNLTDFGPYQMPFRSFQYGIDSDPGGFNEGACPAGFNCSLDLREDAMAAWRADVGNKTASSFELVFILGAGQDESSTWQEFGEMKFDSPESIPPEFGPPGSNSSGSNSAANSARTRYVPWTSWASAASFWPNAGGGSSVQTESSGMGTYAHECSHLLGIGDNYNNPYSTPARRDYTGPFSMLSRGSFNGPGGPHTRWMIPSIQGGSLGSLHTVRDKVKIGLVNSSTVLQISTDALASQGIVVANITARSVDPGLHGLIGLNITMKKDLSPKCNTSTDPFCDGGGYNNYNIEVIDRMGADSFQPDSGVMISKTRISDTQPFQVRLTICNSY